MNYINKYNKPYMARNMLIKKTETMQDNETGYINVGVFTASGAFPVQGAIVTIYDTNGETEGLPIYRAVTNENGSVPQIELPVESSIEQQPYTNYSTYNMMVEAPGFYTVIVIDIQVYPNISTDYTIYLIPVARGDVPEGSERRVYIPSRPIE